MFINGDMQFATGRFAEQWIRGVTCNSKNDPCVSYHRLLSFSVLPIWVTVEKEVSFFKLSTPCVSCYRLLSSIVLTICRTMDTGELTLKTNRLPVSVTFDSSHLLYCQFAEQWIWGVSPKKFDSLHQLPSTPLIYFTIDFQNSRYGELLIKSAISNTRYAILP
jgi:hypothetical protein